MTRNLETVSAIYAAFAKGDVPAILACLAEDVRWEEWADNRAQKAGVPWMQARRGREGARAFFDVVSRMKFREFQVLGLMEGGRQVAAELVVHADVPASGSTFRDEEIHLWTFNEAGQVTRFRHYADTSKHIGAALGTER